VITADSRTDHLAIAARHATPDRWPVAPRFDAADRWYQRIAVAPGYEVWLLTWLPGQGTEIHDHGGSAGAFVVLAGLLSEWTPEPRRWWPGPPGRTRRLSAGAVRPFGEQHIHQVRNDTLVPAVSLHVYAPRLHTMTRFARAEDGLVALGTARAGSDW
jgi:hypothetical protein